MRWQQQHFGAMKERTLENAQVYLLARNFDFSRDSRLARIIVEEVNTTLDAEEQRRQVKRVRTGELLLKTRNGPLILPIRTAENLARRLAGEDWGNIRKDILAECERRYRELFPKASPDEVRAFLRVIWQKPRRAERGYQGKQEYGPRADRPWGSMRSDDQAQVEVDPRRLRQRSTTQVPRPGHLPETFKKLRHFLAQEANVPAAVADPMLRELVHLRARFYPRLSMVHSGQMPLAVMHVDAGRNLWACSRHQPLAPVLISVLARGEYRQLRQGGPRSYQEQLAFHGKRMARVLPEAYVQHGLISFAELEWVFLLSKATVSRTIDFYHRNHQEILPCPGTVLDMGRMLTHKDKIVRHYLEGLSVLEIVGESQHNPRSIDAYLKSFDAVLILHLYGLSPALMGQVLGRGQELIGEYLSLISQHLKNVDDMRDYLRRRGVKIPLNQEETLAESGTK